jgi:hypothetical protein
MPTTNSTRFVSLPKYEIRRLDGGIIASTSMRLHGLESWVRAMICEELDCRPEDVSFGTDHDGEGWIMVETVTGWDTVAQDFATKLVRVGYYQLAEQPIRDVPPAVFAFPFLEAAE